MMNAAHQFDERDEEQRRLDTLRAFVANLERERDACVDAKAEIEARWVDDCLRRDGEINYNATKDDPVDRRPNYREPHVGYVRSRCNMVASRLADMVFPSHDASWDLSPTPKPTLAPQPAPNPLAQAMQQPMAPVGMPMPMGGPEMGMPAEGMPPAPNQDPQSDEEIADAAAEKMKQTIADYLAECRFNAAGRRMIDDCVLLGTGVMKGPVMSLQTRRRVNGGRVTFRREEVTQPAAEYVDPWMFFPELTETMEECTQVHELHIYTERMMRDLVGDDFFDPGTVAAALKTPAGIGSGATRAMGNRCRALSQTDQFTNSYAVWETHKFLGPDDLQALGIDDDEPESMPLYELWYCNGILMKARPAIITGDNRVPYFTVPYQKADDTMFGFGVSYLLRSRDQDIQAAWKITLHNAAMSSGPLLITQKGLWKPANNDYNIKGPQTILAETSDGERVDLRQLFHIEVFPNNIQDHLLVLQRAIELADEEIGMPAIMSGNPSENVQTSSGLALLMNASNIVQRRFAMQFDDNLIVPLIERMYWWVMIYGEDDSAKGDYDVHPLGTSHLLVKDIQAQHVQVFTQIAGDPRFAPYIDNYALLKANVKLLDLPTDDLLRDRAEAEAEMANAAKDPRMLIEEAKIKQAEGELALKQQKAADEAQDKQRDDDFRSHDRILKNDEFMLEQQTKQAEIQARLLLADGEREMRLVEMQQSGQLDMAKLANAKEIEQLREQGRRMLAGMKVRESAEKAATARQEMLLKINPANRTGEGI